jgi:hypothetical protein
MGLVSKIRVHRRIVGMADSKFCILPDHNASLFIDQRLFAHP